MVSNMESIANDPDPPIPTNPMVAKWFLTLSLLLPPRSVSSVAWRELTSSDALDTK